jgi:hypothetical protein
MSAIDILQTLSFGSRVAEEEAEALSAYFVETDQWRKLFADAVDVIYGPKGSGKSALYSLLISRENELFDRRIILAPAENPRGAPAFRDLRADPPVSELEFVSLWKLYLLCLISDAMDTWGVGGKHADTVRAALAEEGLIRNKRPLAAVLRTVKEYVRRFLKPTGVEGTVNVDPISQQITGFSGKISLGEPTAAAIRLGAVTVDDLLGRSNKALEENGYALWLLLDRLDVAFAESDELEQNALRALFKVYLDLLGYGCLRLKIFLRTDIWTRITTSGFREASHVTRHLTLEWNKASLLNMVVRRACQNDAIVARYSLDRAVVIGSTAAQEGFFYQMCPDQVDVGPNKPKTFDWTLSRTRDGTQRNAPRELIHLFNSLRDEQVRKLELGDAEPENDTLFVRAAFKDALPTVSKVRLEQTLYAEYPALKPYIEKLKGQKASQSRSTLMEVWGVGDQEAARVVEMLTEVGFFEQRGSRADPTLWIPFLYRDALELTQGSAE